MKLAVICANGKAGQCITREAVSRGLDVTAVVRGENRSAAKNAVLKDLFALTPADLQGYDAVVDAFGAWTPETIPQITDAVRKLCDVLADSKTRLLIVGGPGAFMWIRSIP